MWNKTCFENFVERVDIKEQFVTTFGDTRRSILHRDD